MIFALAHTNPPSREEVEPIVRRALDEDLGKAGDITTGNIIAAGARSRGVIAARVPGVVCGLIAADLAFKLLDANVRLDVRAPDGSTVAKSDVIAELEGPSRALLTGERTALNFIGHLSGIATATHAMVERIKGTKARILDTRKTTPGLRMLEKYAVRCGGGANHRIGLFDAVLIKDNHILAAGGIREAVAAVRRGVQPGTSIEVEADSLDQLEVTLSLGVEKVLLDNMDIATLTRAVSLTKGRALLEASGGVTLETVRAIAETGVDFISSGALTHSARNLDVGLDFSAAG
jgi:nicotinate-nucleotide pyrophosphorylase (carboxylating)